jgi:hypothetical protein
MSSFRTILLLLPILLTSCRSHGPKEPCADYYINPAKDLRTIGRATLVELANDSSYPEISFDVTESLFQALQKKQCFGLTVVNQNDPVWRSLQLGLNTTYTYEQLSTIRKTLKSNAMLVGAVTGYKPYPNMLIGLRLKLIDLSDGQLIWALEQVWDSTDKKTEDRIKDYYKNDFFTGESLEEKLGTISSLKFIKFVACETSEALQPGK